MGGENERNTSSARFRFSGHTYSALKFVVDYVKANQGVLFLAQEVKIQRTKKTLSSLHLQRLHGKEALNNKSLQNRRIW